MKHRLQARGNQDPPLWRCGQHQADYGDQVGHHDSARVPALLHLWLEIAVDNVQTMEVGERKYNLCCVEPPLEIWKPRVHRIKASVQ